MLHIDEYYQAGYKWEFPFLFFKHRFGFIFKICPNLATTVVYRNRPLPWVLFFSWHLAQNNETHSFGEDAVFSQSPLNKSSWRRSCILSGFTTLSQQNQGLLAFDCSEYSIDASQRQPKLQNWCFPWTSSGAMTGLFDTFTYKIKYLPMCHLYFHIGKDSLETGSENGGGGGNQPQ